MNNIQHKKRCLAALEEYERTGEYTPKPYTKQQSRRTMTDDELRGFEIGYLTAIDPIKTKDAPGLFHWLCDCGNSVILPRTTMKRFCGPDCPLRRRK